MYGEHAGDSENEEEDDVNDIIIPHLPNGLRDIQNTLQHTTTTATNEINHVEEVSNFFQFFKT